MLYLYSRVSTGSQDLKNQKFATNEWLKKMDLKDAERVEISDNGVSGSVPIKDRNLNAVVLTARKGDKIIVSEISRISRDKTELYNFISKMRNKGIYVFAIKENREFTGDNLADEILNIIAADKAQAERLLIKQRTKEALAEKQACIKINGYFMSKGDKCIYQLGNPKWEESIEKAREARQAKRKSFYEGNVEMQKVYDICILMRGQNKTFDEIARYLNDRDYKTPRGRGWFRSSVCRLLKQGDKYYSV